LPLFLSADSGFQDARSVLSLSLVPRLWNDGVYSLIEVWRGRDRGV
jgi:hypothetical protein